ncbi:unnamed protein product [Rhizopus stolonifer]
MTSSPSIQITMASLKTFESTERCSVFVNIGDRQMILCSLVSGKCEQQVLNFTRLSGEKISLFSTGKNIIHLVGNYISQNDDLRNQPEIVTDERPVIMDDGKSERVENEKEALKRTSKKVGVQVDKDSKREVVQDTSMYVDKNDGATIEVGKNIAIDENKVADKSEQTIMDKDKDTVVSAEKDNLKVTDKNAKVTVDDDTSMSTDEDTEASTDEMNTDGDAETSSDEMSTDEDVVQNKQAVTGSHTVKNHREKSFIERDVDDILHYLHSMERNTSNEESDGSEKETEVPDTDLSSDSYASAESMDSEEENTPFVGMFGQDVARQKSIALPERKENTSKSQPKDRGKKKKEKSTALPERKENASKSQPKDRGKKKKEKSTDQPASSVEQKQPSNNLSKKRALPKRTSKKSRPDSSDEYEKPKRKRTGRLTR